MDADGALTESCPLVEQVEASSLNDPELLPRQRAGEAAFRLLCAAGPDGEIWEHLVVVRGGKRPGEPAVTQRSTVSARTALGNESFGGDLRLAQLDDVGDRLLLVEEVYEVWRWTVRGYEEPGHDQELLPDRAGSNQRRTAVTAPKSRPTSSAAGVGEACTAMCTMRWTPCTR